MDPTTRPIGTRTAVLGGLAVVLLTVLSLAAVAAAPDQAHRVGRASYVAACAPREVPGTRVDVVLGDPAPPGMHGARGMGGRRIMMRGWLRADPAVVRAGRVTFVATNTGGLVHELVVLPLATGARAGERAVTSADEVDESGAVTEASADCAEGAGDGIRPGGAGWVTVRLAPGRYELVCNLRGHYRAGMRDEIVVR
jgi:uncharacterized cupredoxin-like copper-binding protein